MHTNLFTSGPNDQNHRQVMSCNIYHPGNEEIVEIIRSSESERQHEVNNGKKNKMIQKKDRQTNEDLR